MFLHCSARDVEGLGIALAEAMAAGLPIIVADVPACREAPGGGQWGQLVSGQNRMEWADASLDWQSIPAPPFKALQPYGICETWRSYARTLNSQ